jgi:uncharacterized protein with von Willebrand factor type A (vWA) domain
VTVAEEIDAMHAIRVIGIEPAVFKESLAATVVKDEADRPTFDVVFSRFFAVPGRRRGQGERLHPSTDGHGRRSPHPGMLPSPAEPPERHKDASTPQRLDPERRSHRPQRAQRLARERALLQMPFSNMAPPDVEECEALVAALAQQFRAYLSRRQYPARQGRLDIRRTLRRSISSGGVPIDPAFRHRRPGRPDLIALCDFSYSVTAASTFLASLLTPAAPFFRRVRLFAFVDQPVEVSLENGMLIPHQPLDMYARSDFGKVLLAFWNLYEPLLNRNTIVLVLGDARNNRRPPRGDVLGRIHNAVRQVTWLNPEPRERWGTGDSAMAAYERHCHAVLSAANVRELYVALREIFRAL